MKLTDTKAHSQIAVTYSFSIYTQLFITIINSFQSRNKEGKKESLGTL